MLTVIFEYPIRTYVTNSLMGV